MGENPSLSSKDFQQSLSILQREQEANLPSPREERYFRFFNFFVYLFVALVFIISLGHAFDFHSEMLWLWALEGLALLPIIVLFFLNLGFMLKLRRQAKLRKRLHLEQELKTFFSAQRQESRLSNLGTLLVSLPGYVLVLVGLIMFGVSIASSIITADLAMFMTSFIGFGLTVLGLSFIFLHFMRRGKQRLDLVKQLQTSLSNYAKSFEQNSEQRIHIDADEYDQIARIERSQIIADRHQSIEKGLKERPQSGYLIQQSAELLAAKSELDLSIRSLVDDQILQLTTNPVPTGTIGDSNTATFRLQVPATAVEIVYQVDHNSRRIKVFSLQRAGSGDSTKRVYGE